jgi:hypothetical protein
LPTYRPAASTAVASAEVVVAPEEEALGEAAAALVAAVQAEA